MDQVCPGGSAGLAGWLHGITTVGILAHFSEPQGTCRQEALPWRPLERTGEEEDKVPPSILTILPWGDSSAPAWLGPQCFARGEVPFKCAEAFLDPELNSWWSMYDGGDGGDGDRPPHPPGDSNCPSFFLSSPGGAPPPRDSRPAAFWLGGGLWPWPQKSPPPVPRACHTCTHLLFKALHSVVKMPSEGPPSPPSLLALPFGSSRWCCPQPPPSCSCLAPQRRQELHRISPFGEGCSGPAARVCVSSCITFLAPREQVGLICCPVGSLGMGRGQGSERDI